MQTRRPARGGFGLRFAFSADGFPGRGLSMDPSGRPRGDGQGRWAAFWRRKGRKSRRSVKWFFSRGWPDFRASEAFSALWLGVPV
jgi:hypothetical protein